MWNKAGVAKYCGFIALILLISGCGNDPGNGKLTSGASPAPAVASNAPDAGSGAAAQSAAVPEDIMTFLSEGNIPNGDIYLDGSTVHVNIVGLNAEIERSFADRFAAGSYVLHDVNFT
ncbi:hypothetical protein C2I18_25445 [Paenibacillus sp. PK3_47]|uniref:hypothetical protein n=1 Tax=Paenibacillus sp. PK3_47 TaxID=2072642 RepID=UPI00201DD3C1|nr:hypothetical protein [Paenibacillus sp. PK3_47]UQZ36587.1 hypothetical protein C2I18_25445 [Paenibacillus sp. PK3_47]